MEPEQMAYRQIKMQKMLVEKITQLIKSLSARMHGRANAMNKGYKDKTAALDVKLQTLQLCTIQSHEKQCDFTATKIQYVGQHRTFLYFH